MKIISHRGNTSRSLREAIRQKVDEIEFDVRVSSDDIPVLHHDSDFISPKGERIIIAFQTLSSIRKEKPEIITLEELFSKVDKAVSLYIEIKPGAKIQPIIAALKNQLTEGRPAKKMRIASFSQKILNEVHAELPDLPKIINESWRRGRAQRRARTVNTKIISMNQRWMNARMVKSMTRKGFALHAYTINKPAKAIKLHAHGLVGTVTDFPERFKK